MQDSFVERVIFKLVKKHIAGPTMSSAIKKAKELNSKGIPASIAFLSQPPSDTAKANYITATYMQLAREISRLGITASVHLTLEQLGSSLSKETSINNLKKVLEVSKKSGVFVWCELKEAKGSNNLLKKIKDTKGLGVAFNSFENCIEFVNKDKLTKDIKVICEEGSEAQQDGKEKHDTIRYVDAVIPKLNNLVLLSPNEGSIAKLMKKNGKYKKTLIFEFQLGYGEKKVGKMLKRGARLSMYVPFGKDWVNYAINNVPEKYTRAVASRLLSGESE